MFQNKLQSDSVIAWPATAEKGRNNLASGFAQKVEMLPTFEKTYQEMNNAESVRQFQPRVALWQPWENASHFSKAQL